MNTGIDIGTVVDKDSLGAITDAIVTILNQPGDQSTLVEAIGALSRMARVEGVTIQNCIVRGDNKIEITVDDADMEVKGESHE